MTPQGTVRMGLSVIIPSKTASNLVPCMDALRKQQPGINIFVADDGVDWKAIMLWVEADPGFTVGWCSRPFIYAKNCNFGISKTWQDDIVLLNDDAILETPGGFTAMQQFCYEHPEYGLLSARVKGNAHHIHAYKEGLTGISEGGLDVPFVCVYIPRKVLDKVGPLDERFTGSIDGEMVYAGEDTDYCMRIRHAGYKLGVFNECVVDHGTLPSTFRGLNGSLPINATMKRFYEIHGFPMWSR